MKHKKVRAGQKLCKELRGPWRAPRGNRFTVLEGQHVQKSEECDQMWPKDYWSGIEAEGELDKTRWGAGG